MKLKIQRTIWRCRRLNCRVFRVQLIVSSLTLQLGWGKEKNKHVKEREKWGGPPTARETEIISRKKGKHKSKDKMIVVTSGQQMVWTLSSLWEQTTNNKMGKPLKRRRRQWMRIPTVNESYWPIEMKKIFIGIFQQNFYLNSFGLDRKWIRI